MKEHIFYANEEAGLSYLIYEARGRSHPVIIVEAVLDWLWKSGSSWSDGRRIFVVEFLGMIAVAESYASLEVPVREAERIANKLCSTIMIRVIGIIGLCNDISLVLI